MAMQLGLENKKQVRLLIVLGILIVLAGGWQIYTNFLAAPTRPRPIPAPTPTATPAGPKPEAAKTESEGPAAAKISNTGIDPTLHTEKLLTSENVSYHGSEKNIFAVEPSAPAHIEQPIKSPRANAPMVAKKNGPPPPPPVPKPPAIDLKYFGYSMAHDKSMQAFLVHGEDVFMARTGEVINHRYKVGIIRPNSVEITDLPYNNKQTLGLSTF